MNAIQHALEPAGVQAATISSLWWLTIAICGATFVAVLAALFIALRRRPRADATTPPDVTPLHEPEPGVRRTVAIAVGLSVIGLTVLLASSIATDRALAQLPVEGAVTIDVVAHQWWWEVRYESADPSKGFTTANEIVVPVGRPVVVQLHADDVIHSFWVPNLAGKKDLIPGRTATLAFRADREGEYRGQCAEFCGAQHAFMAFDVSVVSPERFAAWQEAQRKPAPEPGDGPQRRGRELFLTGTCMMCHAINGTTAHGRRAPDLTHVASRKTLAAGRLPNTPERLAAWIEDPQRWKPGVNMPAHRVPREELDALVAYLGTLR